MSFCYKQECFTCGQDLPLNSYRWHKVRWYTTADRKRPVPGGVVYGSPDRTCKKCFGQWEMEALQATEDAS